MMHQHERLSRLIHLSGRLLDQESFEDYTALYAEAGEYRLVTRAPEVAQTMTWILLNRQELGALLASAPKHVWNTGLRSHLISVEEVNVEGDAAYCTAGFCVFHTDSRGATQVYAVGRYEDRWRKETDDWKLLKRVARLQTRVLTPPSAIPL